MAGFWQANHVCPFPDPLDTHRQCSYETGENETNDAPFTHAELMHHTKEVHRTIIASSCTATCKFIERELPVALDFSGDV